MMFSESLEYGKYYFQHLQGTVRYKTLYNFEGLVRIDCFCRYALSRIFFGCVATFKNIFSKKKKTFLKTIFLVTAGGLLYPDLKFEGNRRRSDLSQRNIGTSRNWPKMSPECSNLDGSNHICWDIEHYMENDGNIDHSIENTEEIYTYRCENRDHHRKTLLKSPIIVHYQKVWVFWKVESEPVHVLTTVFLCLYFFALKNKLSWQKCVCVMKMLSCLIEC